MGEYIGKGLRIFYNTDDSFYYNMHTAHFHDEYEIYYLVKGSRHIYINDKIYPINSGSLALIDGENMHRAFSPDNAPYTRFIVCVKKQLLEHEAPDLAAPFSNGTVFSLSAQQQDQLNRLMNMIISDIEHDAFMRSESIRSLVTKWIIDVSRFSHEQTSTLHNCNTTIIRVIDFINAHYNEKLTLEYIAQNCYVSVSHLTRLFKTTTGYTVISYINNLRIKKASEMIKSSDLSMSEIASKTGFESLSYFVKLFSQYFGMSPLQYRKNN
ncbi:MAG: helix-turn-helix transcriptional regulator [Clostridia bacterium]|nr:helix-turn-helix transcriptional regulator [Clostridia bacterium]